MAHRLGFCRENEAFRMANFQKLTHCPEDAAEDTDGLGNAGV
jgi:hypothetical protein